MKIDGTDTIHKGELTEIGQRAVIDIESGSRTPKIKIKIKILDMQKDIVPGFDAEAYINAGTAENVVAVKIESVKTDETGSSVVFLVENSVIDIRKVETGISDSFYVEIKSGLDENEITAVNPPPQISRGMSVKPVFGGED